MNKQSLFFTFIVAVVNTALLLMFLQYFVKRLKIKPEANSAISHSYTIWISSILITYLMLLKVALNLIENAIEIIIFSKVIDDTFLQVIQRIAVYTGFTFLFTFFSYYIVHNILGLTMGNRIDSIEIEKENKGYFIIKGVLQIGLVFSLLDIFEHFLQWFAPMVDTPFYH